MKGKKLSSPRSVPSIVGAAVLLGSTALASRFLGLIRDRMLAGTFGAGESLDAYYAAFRVPDLVYTFLVLGALSAGFIPYFTKRLKDNKTRAFAYAFTNKVLNIMGLCLIILSTIGVIFTEPLLAIIAPGFTPEVVNIAIPLSRILYLSTLFLGLSSVFGGVLQGLKHFTLYAIAPLLYNIGIITGVVVAMNSSYGIIAVAWGVVGGAATHLLLQLFGTINAGWRYQFLWDFRDQDVKDMFALMGPRVFGLAISQINLIAMTAIASLLAVGSVTIFHFANNIQYVPIGIVGISFAIAAFPRLCELANGDNAKKMRNLVSQTTRTILFLIVPLSVVFLLLRAQIVRVVLGAGEFGWNETIITADVLAFFVLSLFAQALIPFFVRIFFAYKNTLLPTLVALLSAIINVGLAIYWSPTYGVVGIAMAFSFASIIQCALLWFLVRVYVKDMDELRLLRTVVIIFGAALVSGLMIQSMKELYAALFDLTSFFAVLGQGIVAGGMGLIVYAIVSWAFKSEEWNWVLQAIKKRLFRKYTPSESGDEALDVTV
jgi:putative peptidoglycan lipid II flippase